MNKLSQMLNNLGIFMATYNNGNKPSIEQYSSTSANIGANTYIDKTITLPEQDGRVPYLIGYNVTGTGTASVQVMGVYVGYGSSNVAHVKCKNDSSSSIGPVTAIVWIAWL